MTQLLCMGCDSERATIRAYCHSCEEVTPSYKYEPTEREVFAARLTKLVPHAPYGFIVMDADERRAAA